jgi:hypothetical protein
MARRRAKLELTLFPFLSVLSGLIAVLILMMIVLVSTRVVADESSGGRAEEGIDEKTHDELSRQIDQLTEVLAQRERERLELERLQEELRELIAAKQREMLIAKAGGRHKGVKLGEPSPFDLVPDTRHDSGKKPIFIEIKADDYTMHRAGKKIDFKLEELQGLLREVNQNEEYLLFIIHPSGVRNFRSTLDYVSQHFKDFAGPLGLRFNIGWEPASHEEVFVPK